MTKEIRSLTHVVMIGVMQKSLNIRISDGALKNNSQTKPTPTFTKEKN